MTLSRSKAKIAMPPDTNACADCSKPDPTWASLSRGVLICDECCIGHRRLGRHVSYVRSLKQPGCPQPMLTMFHQLVNNGANAIWEHQLIDPSTMQRSLVKKKPSPTDPQYPNKENFVKAKYQDLLFAIRPSSGSTIEDLSHQLYSSVRTNNVETSLRLLAMGADVNYRQPDRGNQPIHVAAMAGQPLQVELLVVYGGNPVSLDADGRTPTEIARNEGFVELAERLYELSYELTDRMICYLTGRRPDHRALRQDMRSNHILVPEMATIPGSGDNVGYGRSRLTSLSDRLIADLSQDCYDEVDRRETDMFWQNQAKILATQGTVPFLPPNIHLSATRNQSRQKLGLLSDRDFRTLLVELLREIRRRVRMSENSGQPSVEELNISNQTKTSCPTSPKSMRSPTPKSTAQVSPLKSSNETTLEEVLKRLNGITNRLDRIERYLGFDTGSTPTSPSKKQKKFQVNGSHAASNGVHELQSQIFSKTSEVTRIVADLCSAVSSSKSSKGDQSGTSDPMLALAASLWTAVCNLCDIFEVPEVQQSIGNNEKAATLLRGMTDLRQSASSVLTEARASAISENDIPSKNLSEACFSVAQATRFVLAASRQVFTQIEKT